MSDLDNTLMAPNEADDIRSSHMSELTTALGAIWRKRLYTDLTLVVDGKGLKCHRAILAAASPYFHSRLFNGKRESTTDKLYVNTVSRSVMAQVLEFIYFGDCHITDKNGQGIMKAAYAYEISGLRKKCDYFLSEKVNAENALKMYVFATETRSPFLEQAARAVVVKHFVRLAQMRLFKSLAPAELIRIISDNELCVPNEEVVCDIILQWATHDKVNRKHVLGEIFKYVRLPNVKEDYIRQVLENNALVRDNSDCIKLMNEAKVFHSDPGRRHETTSSHLDYREDAHIDDVVVIIGGAMSGDSRFKCNQMVVAFNLNLKKWFPLASLPYGFDSGTASCTCGNDIYISGGGDSRQALALYESKEDVWHVCAPMLTGRRGHAMVPFGLSLYVFGGAIGQRPEGKLRMTASIEEYDMHENTWHQCGQMAESVWGMSAAVCGESVFLMGGYIDRETPTTIIQMYDPTLKTCSVVSSLPFPCGLSRAVITDDVYLLCPTGDILHSRDCLAFNHVATLPHFTRALFGVAPHQGDVLMFGGKYGNDVFEDILVLDLKTMAVSFIPEKLYKPVWGFACVKTCLPRRNMMKTAITELWD
ncbi:kelch-like protein 24 [Haliotis rufescens]|uniref:kelch-like protein 24 n=1 Tax=Haliotis rufescens TaxID=6454 RepID=UPI00201F61CC|nr:kelch-like protein 24 [Haliotis rufescens]